MFTITKPAMHTTIPIKFIGDSFLLNIIVPTGTSNIVTAPGLFR